MAVWRKGLLLLVSLFVWNLVFAYSVGEAAERDSRLMRLEQAANFILQLQDEHGAIVESGYINTDSNMLYALMGLISTYDLTRDPKYRLAVERGMKWLMLVQTPQGDWHLSYRRAGEEYVPTVPGSYRQFAAIRGIDTTMALFIHVAREVDRRTDRPELREQIRGAAKRAYQFLTEHNLDPVDGLYWSSYQLRKDKIAHSIHDYQVYKVKYAADNAETYAGLIAAAALFPESSAERQAQRLKSNFARFFDPKKDLYTVMLDGSGERSMRPAYARWFANGWSACLLRDPAMFDSTLRTMAQQMDDHGAFKQWEGTYTLSTIAYLLGEQAFSRSPINKRVAERYLFAMQQSNGGLADSAETTNTYINVAGMFILYLSRELQK
ncbi:hypothetical protein [Brevibacillus choshinensis]|uniref:hypothetical protein n=1 Tax=Brevibacillus choshinensis TaxID=54911 RepID=UPI002E2457E6|nr:hypothetical protein [Brevibacillus choshinensis]